MNQEVAQERKFRSKGAAKLQMMDKMCKRIKGPTLLAQLLLFSIFGSK